MSESSIHKLILVPMALLLLIGNSVLLVSKFRTKISFKLLDFEEVAESVSSDNQMVELNSQQSLESKNEDFVFYTKVPKTGSSFLKYVIEELSVKNNFYYQHYHYWKNHLVKFYKLVSIQ